MELTAEGQAALEIIRKSAKDKGIDIQGGRIRRTSSRFCLGVEHGDYNGMDHFEANAENACCQATKTNSS